MKSLIIVLFSVLSFCVQAETKIECIQDPYVLALTLTSGGAKFSVRKDGKIITEGKFEKDQESQYYEGELLNSYIISLNDPINSNVFMIGIPEVRDLNKDKGKYKGYADLIFTLSQNELIEGSTVPCKIQVL